MLGSYFAYKAFTVEIHRLSISLQLGMTTKEDILEQLRKALVGAMKNGNLLVIDVGKLVPDFFNDFTGANDIFNPHIVFDFEKFRERDVHM